MFNMLTAACASVASLVKMGAQQDTNIHMTYWPHCNVGIHRSFTVLAAASASLASLVKMGAQQDINIHMTYWPHCNVGIHRSFTMLTAASASVASLVKMGGSLLKSSPALWQLKACRWLISS
jgi:hypothetical protein